MLGTPCGVQRLPRACQGLDATGRGSQNVLPATNTLGIRVNLTCVATGQVPTRPKETKIAHGIRAANQLTLRWGSSQVWGKGNHERP